MTLQNINTAVIDDIKSSNEQVLNAVRNRLVSKEVDRRVDALTKAIEEAGKQEKELLKFRPDVTTYNDDGSVQSTGWSKAKKDEREKATKKLEKLRNAINKALENGDYSQLLNPEQNAPSEKTDESKQD